MGIRASSAFLFVDQRQQPAQRVRGGLHANLVAIAFENQRLDVRVQPVAPAERHHADRLFRRAAARTGNAGDGQRNLCPAVAQRAFGHRARDRFAHRAVFVDHLGGHADHFGFRLVRVGDETALEPAATAGDVGDGGGDHAARAGLGGGEHQARVAQLVAGADRELVDDGIGGHGGVSVAVAEGGGATRKIRPTCARARSRAA
ncbi:hypothetical protein PT2222_160004 [Paraburkholderia tropica]